MSSDLPGVNPATLNGMILYYRLMTKWTGLGDSTELSRRGLSHGAPGNVCITHPLWISLSEHLPLWELDEEMRLLVIALPLWDPQRRRTSFVRVNFGLIRLSLACLSS
jgi:hypothetical protein